MIDYSECISHLSNQRHPHRYTEVGHRRISAEKCWYLSLITGLVAAAELIFEASLDTLGVPCPSNAAKMAEINLTFLHSVRETTPNFVNFPATDLYEICIQCMRCSGEREEYTQSRSAHAYLTDLRTESWSYFADRLLHTLWSS